MCVLVYWFFCALLWLLPMGILPLPVRVCVRPLCSPVCAKLSAKVRKTRIIRLRKRYFFLWLLSFFSVWICENTLQDIETSLTETADFRSLVFRQATPRPPTSTAKFPGMARLFGSKAVPVLMQKCTVFWDFCRRNGRFSTSACCVWFSKFLILCLSAKTLSFARLWSLCAKKPKICYRNSVV